MLGADRIGHGYTVVENEDIYAMAKKLNIHFEVSAMYFESMYICVILVLCRQC